MGCVKDGADGVVGVMLQAIYVIRHILTVFWRDQRGLGV